VIVSSCPALLLTIRMLCVKKRSIYVELLPDEQVSDQSYIPNGRNNVRMCSYKKKQTNTLTNMTTARQRFGKHILEVTQSTVGPPLLGSNSPNTYSRGNRRMTTVRVVTHIRVAWKLYKSCDSCLRESNEWAEIVVSDSGIADTRSPLRNGASLKQSLLVSCHNRL
jgi:hypothetical protein